MISINIEGLTPEKENILAELCKTSGCEVLCLQETHRDTNHRRPKISGMRLVVERPHSKYGSAIFTKPDLDIISTGITDKNNIEIMTIDIKQCTITSIYKPPNVSFEFEEPENYRERNIKIVIGDFNSHNVMWGYTENNEDGEKVEDWAERDNMSLIHDAKLPPSFNSGRWRKGYNPDNIFVSHNIRNMSIKSIMKAIPKTQHRPIQCQINAAITPRMVPFRRRFNFKKAKWAEVTKYMDNEIQTLQPTPANYCKFVDRLKKVSRKYIPRGCHINYIKGLRQDTIKDLETYYERYEEDPFSELTIETGERILKDIAEERKKEWMTLIKDLDMVKNSNKAWKLIKSMNNEKQQPKEHINITPDQIAHKLLMNGKTKTKGKKTKLKFKMDIKNNTSDFNKPFEMDELNMAIGVMKNRKAAGIDGIMTEQIKQLGPKAKEWLLNMFNNCIKTDSIPTEWLKSHVVALLKPGKAPTDASNFRPVSLLCHTYKMFERMVLNRIKDKIDGKLIKQQAGFRAGKSCTGQILNLVEEIEKGYENNVITGAAFIDLSAAYDTVNHRLLLKKIYELTEDAKFTKIISLLLRNRRFFVSLQAKKSRWRRQNNGLPQGSVLSPILFNIYTNDQPIGTQTKHFIYADDLAITTQGKTFEEVEVNLNDTLNTMKEYYNDNYLKPNPAKTQITAFHLRNRDAKRKLRINWQDTELEHCEEPTYLGIKLDRALTYRSHCENTKNKIGTRNCLLQKLVGSQWGADPHVLRTTALSLCYSTGEYACAAWRNSAHAKKVDVALNVTNRLITGCLRPTPVQKVQVLCGIAPPNIRREVAARVEKTKQESDLRHPLYGGKTMGSRLKSRKNFLKTTISLSQTPEATRIDLWKEAMKEHNSLLWKDPKESLPTGSHLPWSVWKTLNRLRTETGRTASNMKKWGLKDDGKCECGGEQDADHLFVCPQLPNKCRKEDFLTHKISDKAIQIAAYWGAKGI